MEAIVKGNIEGIKFGELQVHGHVAVMPIISSNGSGPDYLTLKEAMEGRFLRVTEVTEGGSVPELKVVNQGDRPVLLLDGEELSGAKQNRVLNTTILLRERSETVIPVSCTEHGRWSYRSADFSESGHIMSAKLRSVKNASVHENLKSRLAFESDQCAVWDEIEIQARMNRQSSATGAMKDVLEAKRQDLDEFLGHLPLAENQNGLLVLVNGKVVGLDVISKAPAFAVIHPKLIRSYVMDALTEKPAKSYETPGNRADAFMEKVLQCAETQFDSVGYGRDYRYEGKKIVGSALVHEGTVIHMAFFQVTETEKVGRMSSVSRRRGYRAI
ncbi:MAG: hypothetical protein A4E68_02206 [Syntrophaceae bacterium PtaB.Bin095]|nr:MAG: hypothetical protein A4E68_02206 [Syntrophaceae bacterium PtaB.Bin095]